MIKRLLLLLSLLAVVQHAYAQYCTTNLYNGFNPCLNFAALEDFSLGVLNHQTSCSPQGYGDFTTDTIPLEKGVPYVFTASSHSGGQVYLGMWVDYDDDTSFDDTLEFVYTSGANAVNASSFYSDTLRVDSSAPEGYHRLRVRVVNGQQLYDTSACATYFNGEVHDYIVHILPEPDCYPVSETQIISYSDSEVSFSWNGPGSNYVVEYGPAGFRRGTGSTVNVHSTDTTLSGLIPQTFYDIYIRTDCSSQGNGKSAYSTPLHFRTNCASISSFPYNQDFNSSPWVPTVDFDLSGDTIHPCWSRSGKTLDGFRWLVRKDGTPGFLTGPLAGHGSAGNYLFTYAQDGMPGDSAILQLPSFNFTSLTRPWLSFYYHMFGNSMGELHVQVSSDGGINWTTIYSLIGQQQNAHEDDWLPYGIDLSAYSGSAVSIRFTGVKGSSYAGDMAIDDIQVGEGPSCTPVFNVAELSKTTTSGILYWEGSGGLYEIEYGGAGFTQGTGTIDYFDNDTITLSGLSPNSCYDIYVRNACDTTNGEFSPWSPVYTFCTECVDITTLPWLESFDNWTNCWEIIDNNFNNHSWSDENNSSNAYKGGGVAACVSAAWGISANDWLVSPKIRLSANQRLEFWVKAYDIYTPSGLSVLVSTSGTDVDDFQDTLYSGLISGTHYRRHRYSLAAFNGDVHIAFVNGGTPGIYLDEVLVENIPTCAEPDSLEVTAVSDSWARLDWITEGETNPTWRIQYGAPGFAIGSGTIINSFSHDTTIYGLSPASEYDLYVQTDCGGNDTSTWTGPVSFTTLCSPLVAPVTENFEDSSSTRSCWTQDYYIFGEAYDAWVYEEGSSDGWSGPGSISNAFDGVKNARFSPDHTGPDKGKLISPILDLSGLAEPFLTFYYGQEGSFSGSNYLNVYYRDSVGKDWTILFSDSSAKSAWTRAGIDLPDASSSYQLAFEAIHNLGYHNVIDQIEIGNVPACPDAYNITGSNYTYTSVDINWTGPNGTKGNIWYGTPGFYTGPKTTIGSKIYNIDNGYTLSGLQPGTDYDLYVQSICGSDTSDWSGPFSFTTLCDPAPVNTPFMDDFEAGINCYTVLDENMDGDQWELSTLEAHTGAHSVMIRTDMNGGFNDDWLITPHLHLGSNDSIIFYHKAQSVMEPDTLVLLMSTDSTLPSDFSTVLWSGKVDNFDFEKVSIDLSSYADSNVYFAFHIPPSGYDGFRVFIDNLFVGDSIPPICVKPGNFAPMDVSAISCDSVLLEWEITTGLVRVEYDTSLFTPGSGMIADSLEGTSAKIGELSANTNYDFYLANICPNGGVSEYVGPFSVNTGGIPLPEASFTYQISQSNPREVTFDASSSLRAPYSFFWNFGDGNSDSGATVTHIYNALIGTFTVNLTVENNCGSDDTTMVITGVGLEENQSLLNFSVFPNPAREQVTLELFNPGAVDIHITSITGKEIYNNNFKGGKIKENIHTAEWPRGVYLINISTAYETISRKLVLQ